MVTASALLDVLTRAEVEAVAAVCAAVAAPALLALTVVGQVRLDPADPADAGVAEAFDAHQRRVTVGRALLGPDAVQAARNAFEARGFAVVERSTPWRLGSDDGEVSENAGLAGEWLAGWVGAAAEQDPAAVPAGYLARRLGALRAGRLAVRVGHADLLALPPR